LTAWLPVAKQDGFYIVLAAVQDRVVDQPALAEAATLLRLKVPELNRILSSGQLLPLSRVSTLEETPPLMDQLRSLGIESLTVAEEDLHMGVPAKNIRALEFADDAVTAIPPRGATITVKRMKSSCWLPGVCSRVVWSRRKTASGTQTNGRFAPAHLGRVGARSLHEV
jgi:hypothetical protein